MFSTHRPSKYARNFTLPGSFLHDFTRVHRQRVEILLLFFLFLKIGLAKNVDCRLYVQAYLV